MLRLFFYPLKYFRLQNPEKGRLDVWPTVIITVLIICAYSLIPGASFFRANGFVDKLLTLTSCLTGFYVAALVAASTFTLPDLDRVITSGPIILLERDSDGNLVREHLTRREFACAIFGYLSYLSLLLSIGSAFLVSIASVDRVKAAAHPIVGWAFTGWHFVVLRIGAMLFYSLGTAHLIAVTALGLYYLMDRLHRRDQKITSKKPTHEAA
jgi:hypothetical protein